MTHCRADVFDELVATVRRGVPWRDALQAALTRAGRRADQPSDERAATWIWLAELPGAERAVVLSGGLGYLAAGLAPHFASICYQDSRAALVAFARLRFGQDGLRNISTTRATVGELCYRPSSVDCVALQDVPPEVSLPELASLATQWRRTLRPGGCLYLGWHTGHPYRRRRRAGPPNATEPPASRIGGARRVMRTLCAVGFRTVRLYYATPSHRQLENIVPAARHAVVAYEDWERLGAPASHRRALAARLGLWRHLYGSQLVLAYT